jgi:hypothetical protein
VPDSKDIKYFRHHFDASNDIKMSALMADYGLTGYGLFWLILEIMCDQPYQRLKLDEYSNQLIKLKSKLDDRYIRSFINDCLNVYHLFEKDDDHIFYPDLIKGENM